MKNEAKKIKLLFKREDESYEINELTYKYIPDAIEIDGKQGSLPFYFYQAGISNEKGLINKNLLEEKIKNLTENLNKVTPLNYSDIEYDGIEIKAGEEYYGWRLTSVGEMKDVYEEQIPSLNNRPDNLLVIENVNYEDYYFLGEEEFFNILNEIKNNLEMNETSKEENKQKVKIKQGM